MISVGFLYNIVWVKDLESDIPLLESVHIVKNFSNVFCNDLSGIPPEWEIDFCIDFVP